MDRGTNGICNFVHAKTDAASPGLGCDDTMSIDGIVHGSADILPVLALALALVLLIRLAVALCWRW